MRKIISFFCLGFVLVSCKKEPISEKKKEVKTEVKSDVATNNNTSQLDIPTLNYSGLQPYLNKKDNKVYVVNFWATWCAPCIKELPYFEKVNQVYKDQNVEVILVSLDFPKKKDTKLIPYVERKGLKSKVLHLDDVNEQFWIADISEDWSGALPATLIYSKDKRKFLAKSLTQEELENEIKSFIN